MSLDVSLDVLHPLRVAPGVVFARELGKHRDRLAVVTADGDRLTYTELADRVAGMTSRLGPVRRLVLIAASNDLDPLVGYLAALAGGHPVLLTAAGDPQRIDALVATYDPDVVMAPEPGGWAVRERRAGTAHDLHPDLALLLSTSGSTGSPKLVRLSAGNVSANAASIAEYLGIRDTDRAATSLPMQYCYGLSVINSNLLRGAGLVLTNDSVTDEGFWRLARAQEVTSIHGVPYTFELLERAGFTRRRLPSLRYVTQAGGRLEPERVRTLARRGEREGWHLFVMYGQTEATARMAYLPPELATENPSAIGVPIPGGTFDLDEVDGDDHGELIYRGPNVMLGYAQSPADLALGNTVDALATGDIARRTPDGLFEIVGRKGRFVKLFGLRIDLDHVERLLAEHGHDAACTGSDDALVIAVAGGDHEAVQRLIADRIGLPPSGTVVHPMAELPRLSTGKVDYPAIRDLAPSRGTQDDGARSVRAVYAKVLRRVDASHIDDSATFVALGGDSLSYVQASIDLERLLGEVPPAWPTMPVRDLEALRGRPRRFASVETNIVLRAIAIILIVGTHVGLFALLGGAHLLLVMAGWSFARFLLPSESATGRSTAILRSAARVAVPSAAWMALRNITEPDIGLANLVLVNNYVRETGSVGYWFVEALVQILVVLGLVFAVPGVARFDRRHRFVMPLLVLGIAAAARVVSAHGFGDQSWSKGHMVAWFFALGWLAQRARTGPEKALVAGLAVVTVAGYFAMPAREVFIIGGLLLVLFVPALRLPRVLVRPIGVIAGASLYIYLTHYTVWQELAPFLPPWLLTLTAIAVGVVSWLVVERGTAAVTTRLRAHRARALLTSRR